MDAVDPAVISRAEEVLAGTPGVLAVGQVRMRWTGHQLRAECEVVVDPSSSALQAHEVTVVAEHNLLHTMPGSSPRSCTPTPKQPMALITIPCWLHTDSTGELKSGAGR